MSQFGLLFTLIVLGVVSVVIFNFVIFFGAPFLPTRRQRVEEALDLLGLEVGQTLLELGSGDGRLLRAAARRGIHSIGYELNPVLVLWSRLVGWRWRKYMKIHTANYWRVALPATDGIYVFLLQPYMAKLDAKIRQDCTKPVRLVSFAFHVPGKRARKQQNGLFLYEYSQRNE